MQRVLLAVDDTAVSSEAAYAAAEIARALRARVTVLHVYTHEFPADQRSRHYQAAVALTERVAGVIARSRAFARAEVRCAETYAVADEILDVARTLPADFVVIGSRGRRPLAELLLGSVSHDVVAGAPCPVLVVRSARHLAHRGVQKILLAIEGDAESEALFMATAGLALGLKAEVEVVHAYYPGEEDLERDLHRARASHGEQAMEEIAARLRRAGVEVTTRRLTGQSGAARELAGEADAEDAGLIVMGSGRMTKLVDRLAGSVAEGVLHRTQRPVLLAKVPSAGG